MRDKQIEEMSEVITTVMSNRCWHNGCTMCEFEPENHCQSDLLATALVEDYGYRKASDVAREIFEEIEKLISSECLVIKDENGIRGYVDASVHYILAELKKKYESEGEG